MVPSTAPLSQLYSSNYTLPAVPALRRAPQSYTGKDIRSLTTDGRFWDSSHLPSTSHARLRLSLDLLACKLIAACTQVTQVCTRVIGAMAQHASRNAFSGASHEVPARTNLLVLGILDQGLGLLPKGMFGGARYRIGPSPLLGSAAISVVTRPPARTSRLAVSAFWLTAVCSSLGEAGGSPEGDHCMRQKRHKRCRLGLASSTRDARVLQ